MPNVPECPPPVLMSIDNVVQMSVGSLQLSNSHWVKMIQDQTKTVLWQTLDVGVLVSYWSEEVKQGFWLVSLPGGSSGLAGGMSKSMAVLQRICCFRLIRLMAGWIYLLLALLKYSTLRLYHVITCRHSFMSLSLRLYSLNPLSHQKSYLVKENLKMKHRKNGERNLHINRYFFLWMQWGQQKDCC